MKIFTQVNRSQGMIRTLVGLKSRITSTKPLLTMLALLMVALFGVSENAWGADCNYTLSGTPSGNITVVHTRTGGWPLYTKYYNFPTMTICTLTNSYGITAISFSMRKDGGWNNGDFKLQCYTGSSWEDAKDSAGNTITWNVNNDNTTNVSATIDPTSNTGKATQFRVVRTTDTDFTSSKRYFTISNVKVTMATTASMPSTLSVGSAAVDGSESKTFKFKHSNRNGQTVTFSSNQSAFTVSPEEITLGCSGPEEIEVTYRPTCDNKPTSATITAKCGNATLGTLEASASSTLNDQTVTWNTTGKATSLVAGDTLIIGGYASSSSTIGDKPAIRYTSSNTGVIRVSGDTLFAVKGMAGHSADITAHQDADCKFAYAYATQTFQVTEKAGPTFTLYINNVAQATKTANLKVGDVVEIHCTNSPHLQLAGEDNSIFEYSVNGDKSVVTVTAKGEHANAKLTVSETGNTRIAALSEDFTFNISKHETELSSLLDVNDFYVGNSVYAATAYDFANGTAYNTNNSEVDVHFSSTDENVINLVNGQIKALKAGKATITISQTANNKWTGASVQQTITVKKRPAVFTWNVGSAYTWNQSISNPFTTNNSATEITCVSDDTNVADYVDGKVVIYNVTGTAHFTLTQAGNAVWEETEKQYTVNVTKPNNHVELVYSQSLFNSTSVTSKSSNVSWSNGMLKLGADGATNWDDKYAQINFEGVPNNLNFTYYTSTGSASRASSDWFNAPYFWVDVLVTESTGDKWYTEKWKEANKDSHETASIQLPANAKAVKIHYSGNFSGYISGLTIEERREVKPHGSADVDCGTANHGSNPTEVKAILEWYNVKPLTCWITSDHPEEAFELVTTSINSKLDTYKKNQEITVRGKHDVPAGTYTGTLHVSNGIESTTFNLTTTTTKQTPVISWKNNLSPLSVGDVVADAASAGSATVHYTVDGTYLSLNDQGAVVAENATDENGVDLIAYVIEDETWYAQSETIKVVVTNLLKQTITWNDKLSLKFTGTKEIDLTATASSDLPIKYELSGTGSYAHLNADSSKLVITNIGKTLYLTANQEGDAEYYPASQTKLINSRDPNATCDHILYEDYSETTLHTIDWKNIEWNLSDGEPGRITFYIKRGTAAAGSMAIEEYYDGSWHRKETYSGLSTSYGEAKEVNLNRKTTKISIGAPTGATLRHYVKDIVLHQAKYIEGIPSVRDFSTVTMGTAKQMTFDVKYSNLSKSLDLEIKNENGHFTVDRAYIGDDCGEHGTVTVTVTYTASEYRNTQEIDSLIISNSENRFAVALKANVQRASQTITWDPTLSLKTTDVVAFDAVTTDAAAATGIVVTYAVKGTSDVATITSDGHLTILKDGSVTIVASAEGNNQYEDATPVEKTFTISKVTPTITNNPTISAITLPATLSNVAIDADDATAEDDKHNAVTGSFAWQTETTKVLSGANDYAIVFTPNQPTGKDWYNEVVYNISVTGNQDSQTIIWSRADETTQPCSTPTTFDAYSNKGLDITYVSDNEAIAHVEKVDDEYRLVVTTSGTVHITAKQPGNGDYNAAEDVTKTITLTREQPVITTPPTAEPIFTDNHLSEAALSGGEGQVNGVHAEGIFSWKNGSIQPEAGTHSYTATFTPSPAAWYYPAECQVSVTVSKHPQQINWDYAGGTIYVDKDDLTFSGATSSAELDVYYTTSNLKVAEIDAEQGNKLIIHGKGTIEVIARSEGNSNYYAAEQRRTLTILPLATTVMANPAAEHAITYGQALNATAVVGGTVKGADNAILEGTWSWNNGAEELNAGQGQVRGVTFTPNDSRWYATATSTATVNVNKANPEEMANNVAVTYGTAASSVTLSGSGNGTWSWNDSRANETDLAVNTYSLDVTFTPDDTNNYNEQNTTVQVTVNPAIPDLAWTKAPTECLTTDANVSFAAASEASTGAISYEIVSGTGVTINATSGVLTITEAGTVTIQATIAATQNYESRSITTSLTITPPNVFTNATGNGKWDDPANWSVEVPQEEAPDVVVSGELVIDGEVTVGDLTIQPTGGVTIVDDGKLTVTGHSNDIPEYGDIHVTDDGALELESTAVLEVRNFTLDAKLGGLNALDEKESAASGQVDGTDKLNVNGDVYFQMCFDPMGKISFGWYDFVVPFRVNVTTGIFREGDLEHHLVSGVDFLIQEYSEAKNANNQRAWSNFTGTLQPGRVYTITFNYDPNFDQNTFLFKNADGTLIENTAAFTTQYTNGNGSTDVKGWNGLGNGMLRHGYITGTYAKMQVYNHAENKYDLLSGNKTFAVGTSFFVQVDENTPSMIWNVAEASEERPLYAPKREANEVEEFLLSLRKEDKSYVSDNLYFSASEDATDAYVIGHDLLKMGSVADSKSAQMWSTKGGKNLCDVEATLNGSTATTPLSIYAPSAGNYELNVEEAPENTMLYLTYNGRAIWNLTYSPYVFDLTKGTTEGYGLKMYVMQVATDVETVSGDWLEVSGNRKVLIDDVIYIVTPEGKMYDVTGKSANY